VNLNSTNLVLLVSDIQKISLYNHEYTSLIYEQRDLNFVYVWLQWPEHCTECSDMYVFAQLVHYGLV